MTKKQADLRAAALEYARLGLKIFPGYALENEDAPGTFKKPPRKGLSWEKASSDPQQVAAWWDKWPDALICLATGNVNNVDVIDIDVKHGLDGHQTLGDGWEKLSRCMTKTPTGGHQAFFLHDEELDLRNWAKGFVRLEGVKVSTPGIDVRTTGGHVVLPPSYLPNGQTYGWHNGDPKQLLAVVTMSPQLIFGKRLREAARVKTSPGSGGSPGTKKKGAQGTRERALEWLEGSIERVRAAAMGTRDNTLNEEAYVSGAFIKEGLLERDEVEARYRSAATECGLDLKVIDEKLGRVIDAGIAKATLPRQTRGKGKESASRVLLDIIDEVELWHDERGEPYATVDGGDHREHLAVEGKAFKLWLSHCYYQRKETPPPPQALSQSIDLAEAKARSGPRHQTWLRVARREDRVYLDLGDESWRAVEVTADGWRMVSEAPVKFRRPGTLRSLPEPERGGRADEFKRFLNLAEDSDLKLVLSALVCYLKPEGPYPMLYLTGERGAAKTSTASYAVELIDPQVVKTPGAPRSEDDMVVTAWQRWLCVADNVSMIPPELADAYCRLATGGGIEKRKHYTNEEMHAINVRRPCVFTGIQLGTEREDFIDRTILVSLAPLGPDEREDEQTLWARFEEARPRLLGLLLDGAALALGRYESTRERLRGRLPRMADATIWAEAAAEAFGWSEGEVFDALEAMRDDRTREIAEADGLANVIRDWIAQYSGAGHRFEGTAQELHDALTAYLKQERRDVLFEQRWWPRTATWLGRGLPNKRVALQALGVEYVRRGRSHVLVATALQPGTAEQFDLTQGLGAADYS